MIAPDKTEAFLNDLFLSEIKQHSDMVNASAYAVSRSFVSLAGQCVTALRAGAKIMLFGNGGSAADAQHIATELVARYQRDRGPLSAIALTTDSSALTAIGNDFGFDSIFSRQVEALGRPGDVAIGISTSGCSPNVLHGLRAARERGCVAAGLSGRDGGCMHSIADPLIVVPSSVTARIQEMHILLGHALCAAIEICLQAEQSGSR